MGSHRADHRAPRRRSASAAATTPSAEKYVGKRVAGRAVAAPALAPELAPVELSVEVEPVAAMEPQAPVSLPAEAPAPTYRDLAGLLDRAPTVELPALRDIAAFDALTDSSTTQLRAVQPAGKRRAVKHAGSRGPLLRGLPTLPVVAGVATIAVAVGGAVVSTQPELVSAGEQVTSANAMTGSFGTGSVGQRTESLSRDSDRDALAEAAGTDLVKEASKHAEERNSALGQLAQAAEKEAAEIALNRWVLPLSGYRLTATYGQYGLWSSYHTGLDFAAPTGTTLRAVTNAVVTSVGFDGAYGNKTVLTLEDGTEIWYCHQSATQVSVGDKVRAGQIIGAVGSTGHVTGPHLHLEVRPGGGDPVDPNAALRVHGVTP